MGWNHISLVGGRNTLAVGRGSCAEVHATVSAVRKVSGVVMRRIVIVIVIAGLLAAGTASLAASAPEGLKRTDLQRHDLSIEGREAIQTRVDFAPGAVAPWHSHPGEELVYIAEGSLEFQLEGQAPITLKTGDVLFVPAGTLHTARNPRTSPSVELATYIVEKGKPLLVRAPVSPNR